VIEIGGHLVRLRNLDKMLYPADGTTKAEVIGYYATVAPDLLPLLAGRPVSRFRWPDGVRRPSFVEKQLPAGTPPWVARVSIPTSSRRSRADRSGRDRRDEVTYPMVDGPAALVWLAGLAALELHVPQWRIGPDRRPGDPDRLVIDLDPGPGTGLAECAEVALLVRDRLAQDGLRCAPVTSGSKGLQLYAPVGGRQSDEALTDYAKRVAHDLARTTRLVISTMGKAERTGKVLLDWSQNHRAKTTISPYSLRGRELPWVAAPRTWLEIERPEGLSQIHFREVLDRAGDSGLQSDLFSTAGLFGRSHGDAPGGSPASPPGQSMTGPDVPTS
jgi:bifunctional non-homologous end joining protein LigD